MQGRGDLLLYTEMWSEVAHLGTGAAIRISFGPDLYTEPMRGGDGVWPYSMKAFYAEIGSAGGDIAIARFDPIGVVKNQAMFELAELYPASYRDQIQAPVCRLHAATLSGVTSAP